MPKYLEILNRYEEECGIHWDRPRAENFVISMQGYHHMDLNALEEELLKNGLQYDFDRDDFKVFDKVCGKTFVYMVLRK